MEDTSDGSQSLDTMTGPMKNGEVSPVKELEAEAAVSDDMKSVKINGDSRGDVSDADDSSDCDNLVIDERPQSNRKRKLSPESQGFRGFKRVKSDCEYEPPMNPYFNESLFELSELHQKKSSRGGTITNDNSENQIAEELSNSSNTVGALIKLKHLHKKKKGNPKLQEYAQYLGLQPTVQFKCSKCAQTGFPSLAVLNEHHKQCRALGPVAPPVTTNSSSAPSTNFRVTRKVFLCSACGTYYENWNLFLHMREMHKRFICLYCLGMFSLPEKLSLHLVSKHNCVPSQLNSEEDFFRVYKEPCFLMCCDCEKVFSERDNFFGHNCHGKQNKLTEKIKNAAITSKSSSQKPLQKNSKQLKNKTFVEHVTGDMSEPDVPKETDAVESISSDKNEQKQHFNDEDTSTSDKIKALEMNDEDLEINRSISENIQNQESPEEANENSVPSNLLAMETDLKAEDVSLPNEKDLITDNHVKSKESTLEDELEVNLDESSTNVDPESLLEPTAQDEESSHSLHNEDAMDECDDSHKSDEIQEETRKVPKVTLKLPKSITTSYIEDDDSDASDKLTMGIDTVETEKAELLNDTDRNDDENIETKNLNTTESSMVVAGSDISIIELELEQPLDKFNIQVLLQKCLKATVPTCVYCNHARKIAVNGKQLGLHAIAEHRFSAIVNSITAEELIPESFVMRIKESLSELEDVYFNLESTSTDEGITFSHVFECFQCRYATTVHKELYLHNRKMHAKTILLCIMCKSNFYSYSELICHLCPGLYELNNDVSFRCCMCVSDNLPSAFRLMVHLRKRHHACDVCLELCHNQSRLSNHVWKHKLHHLCYRCGIAYRNKPDITKHLFWKHGTESVVCKKCLQKKWPHMYHFCIPPSTFTCEECNLNFTKAVALKVHKRLHTGEKLHTCSFENCAEKFISKKLLLKHEFKHREPPEEAGDKEKDVSNENAAVPPEALVNSNVDQVEDPCKGDAPQDAAEKPKPKLKVDVYDLPELNLSESDSSDSEDEAQKNKPEEIPQIEETPGVSTSKEEKVKMEVDATTTNVATEQPPPVLENIWDDFKNYQASKEKKENHGVESEPTTLTESTGTSHENICTRKDIVNVVMMDHDYSVLSQEFKPDEVVDSLERKQSVDHDYCSANIKKDELEETTPLLEGIALPQNKKEVKPTSSSDSSDSDSSSCSCGSNCSCSSSSDSSSSSSDSSDSDSSSSEGRRRQQARRERRKQRTKGKKEENCPIDVVATDQVVIQSEQLIQESDLDTTESDTDEDFYDKQPQKMANKLLAEKRKELMLLAEMGTLINGSVLESSRPSTPSLPETEVKPKKKSKNKKKKKKSKKQEKALNSNIPSTSYQYQSSTVSPLTISLPKNSPLITCAPSHSPISNTVVEDQIFISNETQDSNLRASKRKRIPNKFYGYSSDEEHDRHQPPVLKWRKSDLPSPIRPTPTSPLVVPPITIKAVPPLAITEDVQPRQQQTEIAPRLMHNFNKQHAHVASRDADTSSESNDSSSGEEQPPPQQFVNKPNQPPLYCYCRCPYDEVSEMIGCDSNDCLIEWFHFECVGIMVPPKGQWFCPDCRKKKQQKKELVQTQC